MLKRLFFLVLALGMFLEQGAEAALKSSKEPAGEMDPAAAYNPKPADGDIVLPMPNGLKMVLRPVAVPANDGLLSDQEIKMGDPDSKDPASAIFEQEFKSYVAAPFRLEDLPRSWQAAMGKQNVKGKKDPFVYYFLGKYEISNGQWDAVMGTSSEERADLPKGHISWYDLQDFLHKYNGWLLKEHPEELPVIDGVPGFFRLPNEAEWQYAAEGGNVPKEQRGIEPSIETEAENYAIFGLRYDNPAAIGSRRPNELGIHDMGGNVAEFVQGGFKIPIIDSSDASGTRIQRLHGSEGGLIIKGGGFLAKEADQVLPRKRVEKKMFEKDQDGSYVPFQAKDTGARLILTSVNVPGKRRLNELIEAESDIKKDHGAQQNTRGEVAESAPLQQGERVSLNLTGDPVAELDKIYAAAKSEEMKSNLEQLRKVLGGVNEALNRERTGNLQNAINSTVYMAEALDNIAFRCFETNMRMERRKVEKTLTKQDQEKFARTLGSHFQNLRIATNAYRLNAANIARFPESDIDRLIGILADQHRGDDQINKIYTRNLQNLAKHIKEIKSKGQQALSNGTIWDDVIPTKPTRNLIDSLQKGKKA